MDVHKKSGTACILYADERGEKHSLIHEFSSFPDDLARLRDLPHAHECPIVAIESMGVYRRQVHNILERSIAVILLNARLVKNMPGPLADIKDSVTIHTFHDMADPVPLISLKNQKDVFVSFFIEQFQIINPG